MNTQNKKTTEAFTLVEVAVAMGIAAVCMFSLQALIPSTLKIANNPTDQTIATTMMTSIAQDLKNTPSGGNVSPGFGISLPVDTTNASTLTSTNIYLAEDGLGVLDPSRARYAATVWMSNSASATVTSLTTARIKVYWPPAGTPQGSVEMVTSFNRQFQRGGAYVAIKVATNSSGVYGHDNGAGNGYQNNGRGNQWKGVDPGGASAHQNNGAGQNK